MKAYMINKTDRAIQNLMNLYFTGSEEKALKKAIGLSILNPNSAEVLNILLIEAEKRKVPQFSVRKLVIDNESMDDYRVSLILEAMLV